MALESELLDSLYVPIDIAGPDAGETEEITTKSGHKINFYDLLDESMRLTGNTENGIQTKSWLFGSRWNPSATIKAWDDELNWFIPLKGAKVRARHFLHWSSRFTDANGNAYFNTYRYSVNYSIAWEHIDGIFVTVLFGRLTITDQN